ncbi:hypothetical protein [Croceivirga thetidis]|uniref:Uncharacterized protein n=1 Tax=Croceivirga thetidis TaxID=2721623 RepID=A0ABX1GT32_9FLAO|nr:hypothetical protein [Croceivirga thetidis]NKI33114.1 hypothetical protein [Croceivirga thetidis]
MFKYKFLLFFALTFSVLVACEKDTCPPDTEEVYDLDGNVIGCAQQ